MQACGTVQVIPTRVPDDAEPSRRARDAGAACCNCHHAYACWRRGRGLNSAAVPCSTLAQRSETACHPAATMADRFRSMESTRTHIDMSRQVLHMTMSLSTGGGPVGCVHLSEGGFQVVWSLVVWTRIFGSVTLLFGYGQ